MLMADLKSLGHGKIGRLEDEFNRHISVHAELCGVRVFSQRALANNLEGGSKRCKHENLR